MRSPESNNPINNKINSDPNGVLRRFEESIRPFAERMKQENTPHAQMKNTVRMQCLQNMDYLGLTHEGAQKAAMYFFSLIYENPEEAQIIWEKLNELSLLLQNGLNEESSIKILKNVDRLFELNKGGTTYFWRLIHSIVRGDIEVKEIAINNEQVYHLDFPDNKKKKENNTDKDRQNLTAAIKEKLAGKLIEKPLPELHESIKFFSDHDRACLRKIIIFLQQDADLLIISSEWKQKIKQYFDEIERYLTDSISKIKLEENRSTARKQRYSEYVNHILEGYLPRLREYCLKMADSNQENLFAADALLEPTLVNTNVLINGTEEPSIAVIVNRWNRLMKDIQMIVGENATRWDMPAFNGPAVSQADTDVVETGIDGLNPDEFPRAPSSVSNPKLTALYHPSLSGELKTVTPVSINAQTDSSVKATILEQPALDAPAPGIADAAAKKQEIMKKEILEWAEGGADETGGESDNKAKKPVRSSNKNPKITGTCLGIPIMETPQAVAAHSTAGVDPLGATVAAKVQEVLPASKSALDKNNFCGTNHDYRKAFDSLDGLAFKQAENERKKYINQEINYLKATIIDGTLDLTNQSSTFLLNKLQIEIYRRYVQTDELRKFFISECCRMYNEICKSNGSGSRKNAVNQETKEYVYTTLSVLFGSILQTIKISYDLDQYFGEGKCGIPNNDTLNSLPGLPKLDDFELLSKSLSENDPVLSEIRRYAVNAASNLENLSYYIETILQMPEGGNGYFLEIQRYYIGLKQEHEQIKSMIQVLKKKISGGFIKRLFGKRKMKSEINEYFEALSEQTEKIWSEGIQPSMNLFGKLILGTHRKQIQ